MRPAMPSISLRHLLKVPSSPTTSATMRAPCTGGLLYMARAMRFAWLRTRFAWSASGPKYEKAPTLSVTHDRLWLQGVVCCG